MSSYRFSVAQRFAILRVHGGKCYLCSEPVPLLGMEVDHVLPEALGNDPERLSEAKQRLGLPSDFSINSYPNWLPAGRRCNRNKSDRVFELTPILADRLNDGRSKAAQVETQVARLMRQPSLDRALTLFLEATSASRLDQLEWTSVLEFLAREGPGLTEPLYLAPGLSVRPTGIAAGTGDQHLLAEHAGLRLVEDLREEIRAFREEHAAARQEVLERLDDLSDATHLLATRPPSLSDAIAGNADGAGRPGHQASDIDVARVEEAFGVASTALLGWPQETDGHWLERPELAELRAAFGDPERRLTVLLGGPGSGKSALLARLGDELRSAGTTLLALKADRIDRSVSNLRELGDRHLAGAPGSVLHCLARVARDCESALK